MKDFIDPSEFGNDDELFDYILEELIKPKLRETLGDVDEIEQVSGLVYVFGGRGGVDPEVIEQIQAHVQDGMDLDYVLREMTDLQVHTMRETNYGDLRVRYVELGNSETDTAPISADDLEAMFNRS